MIEYSCTSEPGSWLWYYRINFDTTNLLANERTYYRVLVHYTNGSSHAYWYVFAFDGDKRSITSDGRIPSTCTRSSDGAIQTLDDPMPVTRYDSTNNISFYSCRALPSSIIYGPNPNIEYTASSVYTDDLPFSTWAPLARAYFDNYVPGQGVGEVTIQTDAPSQLLTFTSQRLGTILKYWIRGNTTVEFTHEEVPSSGLEVSVYDRTWQWPAGNRPWGEQIATYTREASAYVGGIFYYQYGTIDSDTRYYTAAGNSRHMAATDGVNLSSGAALNPQETTTTAEDSIWLQNYYRSLDLTLKYTVVRFKGITEWYKTHSQSGWIYKTLINVGNVTLDDPGIYVLFANLNIQGDYEDTFLEVVDAKGSQISSDCIFDSAGYQNVSMFSIFEISEAQQLSFHAKCSNSRGYSFSAYFVKIVSGSLSKSTFSATITSTLSQVGSIQLSPGSYLIEIDSSFNNASMKYYQELRKGNTVIIKDSTYAGTVYATTINACCYVEVLATTTLTLYAKCDANSASLSGFIRALRVADTGS